MALSLTKSGVVETTVTTGTGAYHLEGAVTPFLALGSAENGLQYAYCVRSGADFEIGKGTYTHASRDISRDTILITSANNTDPINWGAGTKDFSLTLPGEITPLLHAIGHWTEDQYWGGNDQYTDPDDDSFWRNSTDDITQWYAGGTLLFTLSGPSQRLTVTGSDDSTAEGPEARLHRISATPAVNDPLAVLRWTGQDSSAAEVTYAKIRPTILSPTAGAVSSKLDLTILDTGNAVTALSMRPDVVTIPAGFGLFGGGKVASGIGIDGFEFVGDAGSGFVTTDLPPLYLCRNGSSGTVLEFWINGVVQGSVSVSGTTTSYNPFTGSHYSNWAEGADSPEHEEKGWVVSAADGVLPQFNHLPLVSLSSKVADRAVYGVVAERMTIKYTEEESISILLVNALGSGLIRVTGPVSLGDLLETSAIPGVAHRQADDLVRSSTVAKAVQSSPDDGTVRLVPCTLMAG